MSVILLNLFNVSYPIIFVLYKLYRMYRGFNMTNYYFAIYNFRNEKKFLIRKVKYLKRAKDMIFNFSLKRNFDQRNKIIEIGGWSVPMSYSRCQWDNPVWVTTLMRQLRFWYQKWTQVPLKWYYSYPIPSNTFISKHQEIKIVYAKYFEMAKLSFPKVLSQS